MTAEVSEINAWYEANLETELIFREFISKNSERFQCIVDQEADLSNLRGGSESDVVSNQGQISLGSPLTRARPVYVEHTPQNYTVKRKLETTTQSRVACGSYELSLSKVSQYNKGVNKQALWELLSSQIKIPKIKIIK